jgi:hypothetical protein
MFWVDKGFISLFLFMFVDNVIADDLGHQHGFINKTVNNPRGLFPEGFVLRF